MTRLFTFMGSPHSEPYVLSDELKRYVWASSLVDESKVTDEIVPKVDDTLDLQDERAELPSSARNPLR